MIHIFMRSQKSAEMFSYHFVCFSVSLETSCPTTPRPCDQRTLNLMSLCCLIASGLSHVSVHLSMCHMEHLQKRQLHISQISWNQRILYKSAISLADTCNCTIISWKDHIIAVNKDHSQNFSGSHNELQSKIADLCSMCFALTHFPLATYKLSLMEKSRIMSKARQINQETVFIISSYTVKSLQGMLIDHGNVSHWPYGNQFCLEKGPAQLFLTNFKIRYVLFKHPTA